MQEILLVGKAEHIMTCFQVTLTTMGTGYLQELSDNMISPIVTLDSNTYPKAILHSVVSVMSRFRQVVKQKRGDLGCVLSSPSLVQCTS